MAENKSRDELLALLDQEHQFPGPYSFKFVVLFAQQSEVLSLLPGAAYAVKPSRTGKYVSITITAEMSSAGAVLDIYDRAQCIEGIIAL